MINKGIPDEPCLSISLGPFYRPRLELQVSLSGILELKVSLERLSRTRVKAWLLENDDERTPVKLDFYPDFWKVTMRRPHETAAQTVASGRPECRAFISRFILKSISTGDSTG